MRSHRKKHTSVNKMTIKEARILAGWTQEDLHNKVGPSVSAIKKWERGERILPEWEEKLIVDEIIRIKERDMNSGEDQ